MKQYGIMSDMMSEQLNVLDILIYASEVHYRSEIISYHDEERGWRQTYRETLKRVAQLSNAMERLGINPGDRVASIALNSIRHLELYYASAAIGAVCHTINPRLSAKQLKYVINHADDKIIFVDTDLKNVLNKIENDINPEVKYVIFSERKIKSEGVRGVYGYEELIAGEADERQWARWDENTACSLCYTSGTTGDPKGALYSHRSCILEAFNVILGSGGEFKIGDRLLPIVPMFHVNAWGMPFIGPLTGASLVMPGSSMAGQQLFDMMDKEGVAQTWGVPTVFYGLLEEMDRRNRKPRGLRRVVMGGSEPPKAMLKRYEEKYGINAIQGWGMTEVNPVGSVGILVDGEDKLNLEERVNIQARGSRRLFAIQMKIIDENGEKLPKDGIHVGELCVRGPTVIERYYKDEQATNDAMKDGWLKTGDIAKLGEDGMLTIVDREKDLIKSGGEWISSVDMENKAYEDSDIYECAVIAETDEKWGERPIMVVVMKEGKKLDREKIIAILEKNFAKWQLPERFIEVSELPHTATGKVSKKDLRKELM